MTAKKYGCDCVISLDADLQDDIEVIDQFIDKYNEGCEVVYGVRNSRKKDTFFKRTTAQGYYKFMKMLGVDIVYNHADYRLLGRLSMHSRNTGRLICSSEVLFRLSAIEVTMFIMRETRDLQASQNIR